MASDVPTHTVAGPNLVEMDSSLIDKAVFSAGITGRPSQDNIPFPFTSPSAGDVPIDTSIFTSLPTAKFNELLQQYEDPAASMSDSLSQTPPKANLTMLSLDGVGTNVVTSVIDTNANMNSRTLTDICTCLATEPREEVPVEQVFLRNEQMYRLPEAGVIALANTEFNAFFKNNQCYVSLSLIYHAVGPVAKRHLEKAMTGATNLDILTMGDNEFELLSQQTGLSDGAEKELISINCLQAICKSISQTVEVAPIRSIAFDDVYRKVLGNNVRCNNCGMIIKKDPNEEKYELIYSQSMCETVPPSGIPFTVGMVSASNAKFCAFQMDDKTYINMAELIRFKMFTWAAIQRKLKTLGTTTARAPAGVEEKFDAGVVTLSKGQWIDLVNLRCCCCMGQGKCTIKGHSEDVWQALKMGQCTYEAGISLIAIDETLDAVGSIAESEPTPKTMSPTSTVTFINLESTVSDSNDGGASNGSEEHVSSTTDDFVPGTPQIGYNEDQTEHGSETVSHVEGVVVKNNEAAPINTSKSTSNEPVTEFHLTEPNGEMVSITIEEIKETDEVDGEEISRQFGFKMDKDELENSKADSENMKNVREVVENIVQPSVNSEMQASNNIKTDIVENGAEDYQDYFIGRPRGRPNKSQDAFIFKPPVEKSVKRGSIYLFPGDCIVPDIEELNRQIENKRVIIGLKNLTSEVMNEKSIADCIQQQKASTAKVSFSQKAMTQARKLPKPQTKGDTTILDNKQDIKPATDDDDNKAIVGDVSGVITIHSQYRTVQPNTNDSQNDKVVIEYVQSRTEPDEQKLIAHEKEIEKAEICFMPSRSNSNTPERVQITKHSKIPEQSVVARNIWPDSQTEGSGKSTFTSPLVNSSSSNRLHPGTLESFGSPVAGMFTPTKGTNTPRTPPAWSVERLAKLTSSKSFSGPDAALLTLATLAAENEDNESSNEEEQTDKLTINPAESGPDRNGTAEDTSEKDITGVEEKITEKDTEMNGIKSNKQVNDDGVTNDESEEPFEDLSKTSKEEKMEILSRLKKCAIFTCDKKRCEWIVKGFTKQAKDEFPELFDGPDSEEIRTQFATVLSSMVTNNFHMFLQERRARKKNSLEKLKEKEDLVRKDSLNTDKSVDEGAQSVNNTELPVDESKAKVKSSYTHGQKMSKEDSFDKEKGVSECLKMVTSSEVPVDGLFDKVNEHSESHINTELPMDLSKANIRANQNLTQDLQLELAVKSITTEEYTTKKDKNMDRNDKIDKIFESINRNDKTESVFVNPLEDSSHEKIKLKRGNTSRKQKDLITKDSKVNYEDKRTKEHQVKDHVMKSNKTENDLSDVEITGNDDPSVSVQSHEPIVVRIKRTKCNENVNIENPKKHIKSIKLPDGKKGFGKKRKRVNSSELETVTEVVSTKAIIDKDHIDKKHRSINSGDTNISTAEDKVNSEGIEKLVIRTDKTGMHVLKSTNKHKRKQKSSPETNDKKRKKLSLVLQTGAKYQKTTEKNFQNNDLQNNEYDKVTESQNNLPKEDINEFKVKPLKIKLSACKNEKQQKIMTSSKSIVEQTDEEIDFSSQNTVGETTESECEDTFLDEKLKFFQAVSLVGPVTGLAFNSSERLSRSPVKTVKDTRLSRSRSASPSKSPVKECVKDGYNVSDKQLSKPSKSKKKKTSKIDDKSSQKSSKSPTRKSSNKKLKTSLKSHQESLQSTESNDVITNTGKIERKHSKSPKRHRVKESKKEKKISAEYELKEQFTGNTHVNLNSSSDKTKKKKSRSPRGHTCTENKTTSRSSTERKISSSLIRITERNVSKSPQKCSSKKGKKPKSESSLSPERQPPSTHDSPKRSPKKS